MYTLSFIHKYHHAYFTGMVRLTIKSFWLEMFTPDAGKIQLKINTSTSIQKT